MIDKCGLRVLHHSLFLPYIMYCVEVWGNTYVMYCAEVWGNTYVMYCAEVWGNTYATNTECLFLLQKKVLRLLCGAKRLDHTSRLFYNLCILKVFRSILYIVELKIGIIMFKAYHNVLPMYVQQFFSQHESVYKCNSTKLHIY